MMDELCSGWKSWDVDLSIHNRFNQYRAALKLPLLLSGHQMSLCLNAKIITVVC